jgi:hypothetical protein
LIVPARGRGDVDVGVAAGAFVGGVAVTVIVVVLPALRRAGRVRLRSRRDGPVGGPVAVAETV